MVPAGRVRFTCEANWCGSRGPPLNLTPLLAIVPANIDELRRPWAELRRVLREIERQQGTDKGPNGWEQQLVDSDELHRLRVEAASRGYQPMASLARALYEAGLSPEQVLRECYGVDFPREVFVIAAANPYQLDLLALWTNQPWQLVVPQSRGGLASQADTLEPVERRLRDFDPDLLPLLFLVRPGIDIEDDDLLLCYRLTELAEGRSTIFGVRLTGKDPYGFRPSLWSWEGSRLHEVARRGDSLLAVLHEHHANYLHELKKQDEQANIEGWGEYEHVSPEELREVRKLVRKVESFQREAEV